MEQVHIVHEPHLGLNADSPEVLGEIQREALLRAELERTEPAAFLEMIESIGDPANTEAWLAPRLAAGEKVMGFGHAVYRTEDPRSAMLRQVAVDLDWRFTAAESPHVSRPHPRVTL